MLCRACTGGGFSKRELYSDDEDVFFDLHRCVILNGINIIPTKPDLLDRSLIITLLAVKPLDRVEEAELLSRFEVDRPRILGGLFDALSKAIKLKPSVRVSEKPRMADYATLGCAVAEAIGIGEERFLEAYRNNLLRQIEEALHSSSVAEALLKFTDNLTESQPEWKGTATQLLFELEAIAEELLINKRARGWPKAPHALTRRLNQDKTTLQAFGIEISIVREGKKGIRLVSIRKASAASASLVSNDDSDSHSSLKQHQSKSPSAPTDAISSTDGIIPTSNTRVDTQTQTPPIDDVRMLVLRAAQALVREKNEARIDDLQRVLAEKVSLSEIYLWMERLSREGLVEVIDHGRWRTTST